MDDLTQPVASSSRTPMEHADLLDRGGGTSKSVPSEATPVSLPQSDAWISASDGAALFDTQGAATVDEPPTCRVCRSDDPSIGPLFHPCKCAGSIAHVHEDCLSTWLSHSRKTTCELCGHGFAYEKVYRPGAPTTPSLSLILDEALAELANLSLIAARGILVLVAWLGAVPWVVVLFMRSGLRLGDWMTTSFSLTLRQAYQAGINSTEPLIGPNANATQIRGFHLLSVPQGKGTVRDVLEASTLREALNLICLDVVQGQLITCVIVVTFVLGFLLREYIIQNAPPDVLLRNGLDDAAQPEALPPPPLPARPENNTNARAEQVGPRIIAETGARGNITNIAGGAPVAGTRLHGAAEEHSPDIREPVEGSLALERTLEGPVSTRPPPRLNAPDDVLLDMLLDYMIKLSRLPMGAIWREEGEQVIKQDPDSPVAWTLGRALQGHQSEAELIVQLLIAIPELHQILVEEYKDAPWGCSGGVPGSTDPADLANLARYGLVQRTLRLRPGELERLASNLGFGLDGNTAKDNPAVRAALLKITPPPDSLSLAIQPAQLRAFTDGRFGRASPRRNPSAAFAMLRPGNELPFVEEETPDSEDQHYAPVPAPLIRADGAVGRAAEIGAAPLNAGVIPLAPLVLPAPAPVNGVEPPAAVNAEEEEALLAEDLEGLWEAIGIKGSLLTLAQNVGLATLVLALTMAGFIHVPYILGKIATLWRFHRVFTVPLHGLVVLRGLLHSALDCLVGHITHLGVILWKTSESSHNADAAINSSLRRMASGLLTRVAQADAVCTHFLESARLRISRIPGGTSPGDRTLAVLFGYAWFTFAGMIYLTAGLDQARARFFSESAARLIRQQLVLIKVTFFIVIELLVFPFVCGCLLHVATLDAFPDASVLSRIALHRKMPYAASLVTWLAGTIFMFLFAITVGVCRDNLRPGVMYWIRDPSDPRFHPIRDILARPTLVQLQKVGASSLMYGCVIMFGIGSITSSLSFFTGVLPLRIHLDRPWSRTAADIIVYQSLLPIALDYYEPRLIVFNILRTVGIRLARSLQLIHFLYGSRYSEILVFGQRRSAHWYERLPFSLLYDVPPQVISENNFFLRVPCTDSVHVVNGRKMHIAVHEDGTPLNAADGALIAEQKSESRADSSSSLDDYFTVVRVPKYLVLALGAWMGGMWAVSVGLVTTIIGLPLLTGRAILDGLWSEEQHDAYAYAVGVSVCTVLWQVLKPSFPLWIAGSRMVRRLFQPAASRTITIEIANGVVHTNTSNSAAISRPAQFVDIVAGARPLPGPDVAPQRWPSMAHAALLLETASVLVLGGCLLPVMTSVNVELYILGPLRSMRGFNTQLPVVYLADSWSYGTLYLAIMVHRLRLRLVLQAGQGGPYLQTLEAIGDAWAEGHHAEAIRKLHRGLVLPTLAWMALAAVAPAALLGLFALLTPSSFLAPFTKMAGWHALSSAEQAYLVLKGVYPACVSWYSHYRTTRLCVKGLGKWLSKVRDKTWLAERRLKNYEQTSPRSTVRLLTS